MMAERAQQTTDGTARGQLVSGRLDAGKQRTIFATGGVLGAIAMSSCCIVPLLLFSLGVTGAWIGNLTSLYPYKPYFFMATAVFIGLGFFKAYGKPAAQCDADGICGTSHSIRITKIALWLSTLLALAALAFPYYAPHLLET